MADSTLSRLKDEVVDSPAADRLKDELRSYLQARATKGVSDLGEKLGGSIARLGEPGDGSGGGLMGGLAKGGQALSEGKSPAQAAVKAGGSLLKDKVKQALGGGSGAGGGGKSKSVVIVEDVDVGVPVREAYDQWTQFQEFSTFAKGVVSVEKADDTTSNWKVKVAKSTRSWQANVTEQVPDERISWTTEGAKGDVKGVVTFHRLTDDLTRVLLVLEYFPKGLFEKTGNIWRAQGRRARLDLKLYRKFLMMRGEATDGWRGEIRDGEVVVEHEDAVEEEESARPEAGEDGEDAPFSEAEAEAEAEDADEGEEADADGAPLDEDEPEGDEPVDEDEPAEDEPAEDEPADDEPVDEDEESAGRRPVGARG